MFNENSAHQTSMVILRTRNQTINKSSKKTQQLLRFELFQSFGFRIHMNSVKHTKLRTFLYFIR